MYFNPRSPCGERRNAIQAIVDFFSFQSALPLRGATQGIGEGFTDEIDFNPRSPCGERPSDVRDSAL